MMMMMLRKMFGFLLLVGVLLMASVTLGAQAAPPGPTNTVEVGADRVVDRAGLPDILAASGMNQSEVANFLAFDDAFTQALQNGATPDELQGLVERQNDAPVSDEPDGPASVFAGFTPGNPTVPVQETKMVDRAGLPALLKASGMAQAEVDRFLAFDDAFTQALKSGATKDELRALTEQYNNAAAPAQGEGVLTTYAHYKYANQCCGSGRSQAYWRAYGVSSGASGWGLYRDFYNHYWLGYAYCRAIRPNYCGHTQNHTGDVYYHVAASYVSYPWSHSWYCIP